MAWQPPSPSRLFAALLVATGLAAMIYTGLINDTLATSQTTRILWLGMPLVILICGVVLMLVNEYLRHALIIVGATALASIFVLQAFVGLAGQLRQLGEPAAPSIWSELKIRRLSSPAMGPHANWMPMLEASRPGYIRPVLTLDKQPVLPLGGIARRRVLFCHDGERWHEAATDGLGFRNPVNLWREAPVDAILLGDSFVQGYCVPDGHDIAAGLRQAGFLALNLGDGGRGPLWQLAVLREFGSHLKPRYVLWFHLADDDVEDDLLYELQSSLMLRYLDAEFSQRLMVNRSAVDRAHAQYIDPLVEQRLASPEIVDEGGGGFLRTLFADVVRLSFMVAQAKKIYTNLRPKPFDLYRRILRRARDDAATWGGTLIVVNIARLGDTAEPSQAPGLEIARDLGLGVVDLVPFIGTVQGGNLFNPANGHYNEKGYRRVAEFIARVLKHEPAK